MKVAIIGYGFVGKALHNGFKGSVETFLVDPKLNTTVTDLKSFSPDIVFICVPSPMNNDGSQDLTIINSVVIEIQASLIKSQIVIKSTILPDAILGISKEIPDVVYNPEFLREMHADEDFINSEIIVFGGEDHSAKKIAKFYEHHTNCINKNYHLTDLITASMIKYTINSFLATKVIFFNEIFNIFQNLSKEGNWLKFIEIIASDKRIGNSHMSVPGHDNRFGFGGACLPKDCLALINYANELGSPVAIIEKSVEINNTIRAKYKNKTKRELDQNIKVNAQEKE